MFKKTMLAGKTLLLGLLLVGFTQSCTNLDEEIFSDLTSENFPTTEEQFISALGATYTSLYGLLNHNSIFSLQEVSSDEIMIPHRGADWFDGGQWLRVHAHDYNDAEQCVNNGWNFLYGGVNNCNRVVTLFESLVEEGSVAEEDAAAFIAEVKTLRALFYFWLLDGYGNVPIVTSFDESEPNPPTRSRTEVYEFIETELAENVPNLSQLNDISTYARMNYWAGKALQAKLWLNAEVYVGKDEYAKALEACEEIIDSGLYNLEADYFANFNADNLASGENIFTIPYDEAQAQGFNLGQMTLHYSSQATFSLQEQPWNGYCTLQEFYNSYDDTDLRKGEYGNQKVRGNFLAGPQFDAGGTTQLIDPGVEGWIQDPDTGEWSEDPDADLVDPDGEGLVYTPEVNEIEPNALRQAGARVGKFEYENGATSNLNNDFPIFRYSDVLLMAAECLHRMNMSGDGLIYANMVRSRAGLDDLGSLTDEELLAERGREFFYEGWRRQDLIRFGAFGDEWDFKPASDPCKELFPIPINQINANPNLAQNDCY
ncbi:MAG: RagB/SusD family nutrient uptake outer membrane protein [Bacteroidetes bacterium]|nr:RagB/SusD family nutrient uptake outer membrane protein [Bacteroidota bacterium]